LVEAHGLEGLSGAPVFARTSSPVTALHRHIGPHLSGGFKDERPIPGRLHGSTVLLGLWRSSWEAKPVEEIKKDKQLKEETRVPIGMGVVVPANKIAETLNNSGLVRARREEYERRLRAGAAIDDVRLSSSKKNASNENPSHREDFTSLLNAAAKKRPPNDQTSPDGNDGSSGDK
jgi:hypothetical protein